MNFLQQKYLENQATKSQEKLSFSYPPVLFTDFHVWHLLLFSADPSSLAMVILMFQSPLETFS